MKFVKWLLAVTVAGGMMLLGETLEKIRDPAYIPDRVVMTITFFGCAILFCLLLGVGDKCDD